jgi:hypothetical protein
MKLVWIEVRWSEVVRGTKYRTIKPYWCDGLWFMASSWKWGTWVHFYRTVLCEEGTWTITISTRRTAR